jgi:hypothetical protein
MKTRYTVALSMLAGVAVGALAFQGLHAQANPDCFDCRNGPVMDDPI